MAYPLQEKYINLLTDFGFKRVFGTEPNKALLIDFLNTLLPPHHRIRDVTYKSNENLGSTPVDRKAIFDIYCQGESGERFIVEIQKAKQNFFKDCRGQRPLTPTVPSYDIECPKHPARSYTLKLISLM